MGHGGLGMGHWLLIHLPISLSPHLPTVPNDAPVLALVLATNLHHHF